MTSRLLLLALLVDGLCAFVAPTLLSDVVRGDEVRYARIAGACVEMTLEHEALDGGRVVDDGHCGGDAGAAS